MRGSATDNFDEIKDLFYDICQLDVMSCIEIDKAKKEFVIDNKKELNALREKYSDILTDYDTGVRPMFFKFLAEDKGYFKKGAKSYVSYETSMDYLSDIIRNKELCRYKRPKLVKLSDVFNGLECDSKYNWKQTNKIVSLCREYESQRKAIWASDSDNSYKITVQNQRKEELFDSVSKMSFTNSTILKLINMIDDEKYSDIKQIMFLLLFILNSHRVIEFLDNYKKDTTQKEYNFYDLELKM